MNYKLKRLVSIVLCMVLMLTFSLKSAVASEEKKFDAGPFIIEHVTDSYGWHICGEGEKSVTIPLPIMLWDNGHFVAFMSNKLHHGEAAYKGYAQGWGEQKGSIVKLSEDFTGHMEEGVEYPVDHVCKINISITKNVCSLFISLILIGWIFLSVAKQYKKRPDQAPRGLQALVEPVVIYIQDEVINPSLGQHAPKYTPYLLTLFFFILLNNLMGLIPVFPGGANLSGNIAVTGILALITFFITQFSSKKEYWVHMVNTPGVPWWLKIPIPIMPFVETLGMFTKPFVLMVRLFANMTAGHIVVLGFISLIFIFGQMSPGIGLGVSVVSIVFYVFMGLLELLVAFIQAFVFTLLSSIYIAGAIGDDHAAHE